MNRENIDAMLVAASKILLHAPDKSNKELMDMLNDFDKEVLKPIKNQLERLND